MYMVVKNLHQDLIVQDSRLMCIKKMESPYQDHHTTRLNREGKSQ
jgi:hypothetical protein